jgi:hypothetical protein
MLDGTVLVGKRLRCRVSSTSGCAGCGEGSLGAVCLPSGSGVDMAVAFFSERAEGEANRTKVGDYFWRESAKWKQKRPPEDFGSLKCYGH